MQSTSRARPRAVDGQAILDHIHRRPPLQVRPLTPTVGVEVIGADAVTGTPEWLRLCLRQLWGEHGVLLFRGMDFDEKRQVAFSGMFGEHEVHDQVDCNSKEHPELTYLTNRTDLGLPDYATSATELGWHSDQIYLPRPALGALIYAVQVPDHGGDTCWADMRTAYDRLPQATKRRIEGLEAVADYSLVFKTEEARANPRHKIVQHHPLVRTHPITLRKALYLSPETTSHIQGLSRAESDELMAELIEATLQPDLVYRHQWRAGDAVLWDNARVMHRRDHFEAGVPRFMKRTTIRPPVETSIPF